LFIRLDLVLKWKLDGWLYIQEGFFVFGFHFTVL